MAEFYLCFEVKGRTYNSSFKRSNTVKIMTIHFFFVSKGVSNEFLSTPWVLPRKIRTRIILLEQRFFYRYLRFYDRLRVIKESRYQSFFCYAHRDLQIELVILKILSKSKRSRDHGMSPSFTFKGCRNLNVTQDFL
jgi:hypothetical protein